MNSPCTGYYSVIQYCPDRSRMEAANLGVLLFVESLNFLEVRMVSGNDRVRRFFGQDFKLDIHAINAAKKMLEHRIEVERQELTQQAELELFLRRFANEMVFTPLRPTRVENPTADLSQLFEELVGGRVRRDPVVEAIERHPAIRQRFEQPDIAPKLLRDVTARIPILGDELNADYGYQNGRFNLIQIKEFMQQQTGSLLREAKSIAADGHLIYKHPDRQHQEQQLVIVACFSEPALEHQNRIADLMAEHDVQFFAENEVDRLADLIITTAH